MGTRSRSGGCGKGSQDRDSDRGDDGDVNDRCGSCSKVVTNSDCGVLCEICQIWYHGKCQDVLEPLYNVLKQYACVHWYCKACNAGTERLLGMVVKLQNRIEVVEAELERFRKERMQDLESMGKQLRVEMVELREEMEKTTKQSQSQVEPKWSEVVNQAVETKFAEMNGSVAKVSAAVEETKIQIEEQKEKEFRQNNVIIYNSEELRTEDKEEWRKNEMDVCLGLFNGSLGVEVRNEDIDKIIRLGKREQGTKRPMLVRLKSRAIKNEIMESLWKLKKAEPRHKALSIWHDLTKKERLECKRLVAIAKQKESEDEKGEFIYRVRGPPEKMIVVKLQART